jgi:hypothetical protein
MYKIVIKIYIYNIFSFDLFFCFKLAIDVFNIYLIWYQIKLKNKGEKRMKSMEVWNDDIIG